jgi:hypothetical protein
MPLFLQGLAFQLLTTGPVIFCAVYFGIRLGIRHSKKITVELGDSANV